MTLHDLAMRASETKLIRSIPFTGMELRAAGDDSTFTFEGYASLTGVAYEVHDFLGSFQETVERGAFKRTLAQSPDVQFLVNHGGMALARTESGTLKLAEDKTGLHVLADLDARQTSASDLRIAVERRDVTQMSFAFRVPKGGDTWDDEYADRTIHEIDLHRGDVSAVNQGASPQTFSAVRFDLGGVDAEDLAAAIESLRSDNPDPDAVALIERAAAHMTSLLPRETAPAEPTAMELLIALGDRRFVD